MDFKNKNIIITGGSSGIGKATARKFASLGGNVFIVARDQKKLDSALEEISLAKIDDNQVFAAFSADVTDYQQVEKIINQVVEKYGPPDILVNSAGYAYPGYIEELPLEIIEDTMKIDFFGTFHTIKAVLPYMMKRKSGHIANISSLAGLKGIFGYSGYSAAKFAVCGLSEVLRSELMPYNISVSVLCPPDTDTPQLKYEDQFKPIETKMVSGSVKVMSPEKVAEAFVKGIVRKKYLIIPGFDSKLFVTLNRIFPPLVNWIIKGRLKKALKIKSEKTK